MNIRTLVLALATFTLIAAPLVTTTTSAHAAAVPAAQEDRGNLVEYLTGLLDKREGDDFWVTVRRLEQLGRDAVPALRENLDSSSEKVKLGSAKALLQIGDSRTRSAAERALAELVQEAKDSSVRVHAIEIYGAEGDPDDALEVLEKELEKSLDPAVLIPLARALWEIDRVKSARNRLVDLLASRDLAVRSEAALTLAEIGYFEGDVRTILRSLKKEPTERGRRAALLDKMMRLSRQLDRAFSSGEAVPEGADLKKLVRIKEERIKELEKAVNTAKAGGGGGGLDALLEEVMSIVQRSYVDRDKTERDELILNAIKGLVNGLDQHSVFMDAKESTEFSQSLDGNYPGIGAQVSKKEGKSLYILRPIYGGPAFREGLLSGDKVLRIDGKDTAAENMDGIMKLLKGPKGSKVNLEYLRQGWTEPRSLTIVRETIEVPSVYYEGLPESIGYIRLTQFGHKSTGEFTAALEDLENRAGGLEGLIIDLRDNPGGRLRVAVQLVDLFVGKSEMPIVSQKGRDGDADQPPHFPTADAHSDFPVVVLINENSASASEIVSGALQDYGRATIIGKRSFGKGSVQNIIPLRSRVGSQLKLTVQYYFLPLGRCIHTIRDADGKVVEPGGISPDVTVEQEDIAVEKLRSRTNLRNDPAMLDWVNEHFESLRPTIPLGDAGRFEGYGKLESLRKLLDIDADEQKKLSDDDLRASVRRHTRRKLEDERGRAFAFDLQEDRQLQVALLELLAQLKKEPKSGSPFAWIPGHKAEKETNK